ncbi:hypothetical protein HMPREF0663_12398 [Hoylesella oralis ATCC 33269]|uniref:Phosphate-selective porin O and P n=1 Tax=Hoylesella oralis ATCC 33269 TaxID=873533 RepID=E7RSY0_9BACT|nr:hypothetical protein [Hoylesella oralis]EFZ36331.1 hypothetical protein HMPREF0663_12398 [Hoylesella oralis ATCC 33269]EPH19891.1 hypothetical protein HMPREF1475_00089 [Hoylesella oralis HGA0225]SHF57637.1 hypothetical protein SAMN05444288_0931 [Hoylesella oralis]
MNKFIVAFVVGMTIGSFTSQHVKAQVNASDSVMQHAKGNRLSIGGYGEVAYSRNFYSDNQYRYRNQSKYKDDPSNGRFDIPHTVIYLGYDFGKGWTLGTEIEFEHTGTGSATEIEADEGGEYEVEVEKGGEVELEQFWINKRFAQWANIKLGHIIVPVGLNNAHHEPLNFFTIYRPEGENTILPSTWHDTGVSFWGKYGKFRYEIMMVAGLDAMMFSRDGWIHKGAGSAYEFKPANKYGFAFRTDNYSIKGLRLGLSGYYGQSMHNTYPNEMQGAGKTYDKTQANTFIGSFDFTLNRFNWIVRGQADYGYISDTPMLNSAKANSQKSSPYDVTKVGKNAVAIGIEAGYDIFSQIVKLRADKQKLYVFGRFDYYNSYIPEKTQSKYEYTSRKCMTFGVNYYPIPQIVLKADYSKRYLKANYNNEPSINIGIAYEGFFM